MGQALLIHGRIHRDHFRVSACSAPPLPANCKGQDPEDAQHLTSIRVIPVVDGATFVTPTAATDQITMSNQLPKVPQDSKATEPDQAVPEGTSDVREAGYSAYLPDADLGFCPAKDLNLPGSYEEVVARLKRLQGNRAWEALN